MSTRILLQTILKLQDQIKTGAANFMDVSAEYFKSTGNFLDDSQKAVALEEINKIAPSNVEPIDFGQNIKGIYDKAQGPGAGDAMVEALKSPGAKKSKEIMEEMLGVTLRGDETFGELMEMKNKLKDNLMKTDNPFSDLVKTTEKGPKTLSQRRADAVKELGLVDKQGLGSLFPKGEPGSIFDQKNSNRAEVAAFMRAMREAGIKNEDVMEVIKDKTSFETQPAYRGNTDAPKEVVNLAEGKRAATALARAADMAADSKVKQELLANLDDDIANYGPDWWKGMGYNEGPMGRESVGNLLESMTTDINNGVIDDLIAAGMEEDKAFEIMRYMGRDVRERLKFDPKGFIRKVAEELEFNDIKYDMTFWDNYVDEILTRIQKPAPRFAEGGLV